MANSDDKDDNDDDERLMIHHWGVFIYKSVSDLNITIVELRDMNFKGKNTFIGSNFFDVCFVNTKNNFSYSHSLPFCFF